MFPDASILEPACAPLMTKTDLSSDFLSILYLEI